MPAFRNNNFLASLFAVCLVTAVLYLAREFLLPLAIAVLIAFLLTPLVCRLQSLGVPSIPSVLIVALLAFSIFGAGLYIVTAQVADLAKSLPAYQETFRQKVGVPLGKISASYSQIEHNLRATEASVEKPSEKPMPVEVVSGRMGLLTVARDLIRPILGPLGTGAIVVVVVLFLLIERQDLRDRFIHLVGRGRLNVTTQTIDDAANRVSKYLGAQLIVNLSYGVPIGIGLYFIGLPNAALWGSLAVVLRFLPYIGPWIAASLPLLLSIAVSPNWTQPLIVAGLFIAVEVISNNVIEPWLYGSSTGLAPTAIVISAVFWTWLWGPGGLLLATPLTVCLAVLGKHVPQLSFLDVLLAKNPPIAPEHRFYQRLLAGDETELYEIVSDYADREAIPELFDRVILPALQLAEIDHASGNLSTAERKELHHYLREALATIEDFHFESKEPSSASVMIVPMRSEGDALAGALLAHLLRMRGVSNCLLSSRLLTSEVQASLVNFPDTIVFASTLTGSGARVAASLCRRLQQVTKILGYWMRVPDEQASILPQGCDQVATLEEAERLVCSKCPAPSPESDAVLTRRPERPTRTSPA